MLHAIIRSAQGAVHVIGDVSEYNLETLVEHARHGLAHGETVSMKVELDAGDHELFLARSRRWMRRLTRSGVQVEVEVAPWRQGQRALRAESPRPKQLRAVGH